ncbi:SpaA isopeptide-forming pilin-related protein [Clostridium sp. DSM 100503]|uniref:MSCRAMM family protein n=1 Tax=Clostridium sp. DSM 100503 TaxID=2963282 RepID=UPI00214A07DE|nr:SpaA isopeptide-forming pilin-related protein [Clostridium sp. DSM 100503]MCR1953101.1 SpaA isopeptide-forming pilin-related protein [Clostridium sp. DSM 100503]
MTGDLTSRNYGIGYVDELLELGRKASLPNVFFDISPNNLEVSQINDYQETEVITTKGSSGIFTFPSDSNVWSVDLNGNKKNTFNIGESFKVRATKGYNGEKRVVVNSELKKPASLKYDGSGGFQDIVKYWNDPIRDPKPLRIKFNGTGKIELFKTDDLGNVLAGVKFGLYSDAGATNKVAEAVTGADGRLVFDNVIAGEYWTKELETLPSHVLNPEIKKVVVNGGDTQRVDYTNEIIKGRIQITKVDEETGEKLQGAEFEIKSKATGQVVDTLVTGVDGTAISKLLPFGEYIASEIKSPNKYTLNGKEYFITIDKHLQTIELTHQNRIIKGRVEINKEDSELTGLKIAGAVFGIFDEVGALVEELTTNENGYAISGLLNYGDYILRELKTNGNYLLSDKEWKISIREDGKVYTYDITNDVIKGKLQIVKIDSSDVQKPVEGANFDIVAEDVFGITSGTVVDNVTTDKDGFAFTKDLRKGVYYALEKSVGNDYWLNTNKYPITISEHGKVEVVHIKNEPVQMKLRVVKYDADSETKEAIKGTKFKVVNKATGEDIEFTEFFGIVPIKKTVFTTNKQGEIVFPQKLSAGDYSLVETEPTEGFNPIEPIDFTIDRDTAYEEIELLGKVHTIEVGNSRIKGNLKIVKIDEETQVPLEGVKFKVTCTDGFMKGQEWFELTDGNGEINLNNLEHGKYEAEEVEGLWNYVENKKPIKFEITEEGKTVELQVTNKKIRGSVKLVKVDAETGRPLEGADFELWNGEKLVGIYTTDKKGEIVVENLEAGNYYWVEVKAPEHYKINQDVSLDFVIYEDNQKVEMTVENEVKTGEVDFIKTDVSTGELIEGAKIEIVGTEEHNKHIKIEFTSSKDGDRFKLPEGDYEFRETLPPEGFVQTTEVGKFSIKDGEITKAELKNKRIEGTLEFEKTDVSTGEVIEGAHIKIECVEGFNKGQVIEFVSSAEGNKFKLEYGKYSISETMPPEGFELTTETSTFEITEDGQIVKAELKNKRIAESLPYTGGTDTTVVLGVALIVTLAGVIMIRRKKATN